MVHSPILLPSTSVKFDVPALDVNKKEKVGAFVVQDRPIAANTFHRYPIALTPNDARLSVRLASSAGAGGSVAVSLYDANGKMLGSGTASRSPQLPEDPEEKRIAEFTVDTTKVSGIYEVVVSTAGSRWNGPSVYNLLVESARFDVSATSLKLAVGESTSLAFSSPQVRTVTGYVTELERLETVKVGLLSQHWTFRKVPFPANEEDGPDFMRLEISAALDDPDSANFTGDLVPTLYYLKDGKTPEVAYQASKGVSSSGKLVFEGVERSGPPVYLAVETYTTLKSTKAPSLLPNPSFLVDIIYSGMIVKQEGALVATAVPGKGPAVSVFTIAAPKKLTQVPAANHKAPRARAKLRVSSDASEVKAEIPITILQ